MAETLSQIKFDCDYLAFKIDKYANGIVAKLTLMDYDWFTYVFTVWLPTKEQEFLRAEMAYNGAPTCWMEVEQKLDNGETHKHYVGFDRSIFENFLQIYMKKHLAQWNGDIAFRGEELAVEFFNGIIENAVSYEIDVVPVGY